MSSSPSAGVRRSARPSQPLNQSRSPGARGGPVLERGGLREHPGVALGQRTGGEGVGVREAAREGDGVGGAGLVEDGGDLVSGVARHMTGEQPVPAPDAEAGGAGGSGAGVERARVGGAGGSGAGVERARVGGAGISGAGVGEVEVSGAEVSGHVRASLDGRCRGSGHGGGGGLGRYGSGRGGLVRRVLPDGGGFGGLGRCAIRYGGGCGGLGRYGGRGRCLIPYGDGPRVTRRRRRRSRQGAQVAAVVDERAAGAEPQPLDLADEQGVVARPVALPDPAGQVHQRSPDEREAVAPLQGHRLRGLGPAGEVVGHRPLSGAQDGHPVPAKVVDAPVGAGAGGDRDQDERGLQGDGREGVGGHAVGVRPVRPLGGRGDHRDPAGEVAEGPAHPVRCGGEQRGPVRGGGSGGGRPRPVRHAPRPAPHPAQRPRTKANSSGSNMSSRRQPSRSYSSMHASTKSFSAPASPESW